MPVSTKLSIRRAVTRTVQCATAAFALAALGFSPVVARAASPTPPPSACTPTAKLVNPCRPWLGAYGHGYPQVASDLSSQVTYHEQRVGRQGDIVRGNYHVGPQYLTPSEKHYAARPSTILLIDWKPSTRWAAAGGGDPAVNHVVDAMADSIRSVTPHKVMLVVAHEPENDVSSGTGCHRKSAIGAGSPAEYRAMWANVRKRFAARGATNVVWVMNYMGYKPYDCLVPQLWPGNGLVDWVMMDAYGTRANPLIDHSVGRFYRFLESASDSGHAFLSKPWGLGEFSIHGVTQAQAYAYWDSVKAAVHNSTYPKLKAFVVFDSNGGQGDNRVAYAINGAYDPAEQAHYNAFANDPAFGDTVASPDMTPPELSSLSVSPRAFRVDVRGRRGTTFRYTLSEPARVVFRIERKLCGLCGDRSGLRLMGRFAQRATKGENRTRFPGRIDGRPLRPGHYRATLLAVDAAGNRSGPRQIGFRVLAR